MARTGRPKAELTLSDNERVTLERWARRAKSSQILALRARIILSCAEGRDNKETAALLRCHEDTVGKWRRRFIDRRLDGLADEPNTTDFRFLGSSGMSLVLCSISVFVPVSGVAWPGCGHGFGPRVAAGWRAVPRSAAP